MTDKEKRPRVNEAKSGQAPTTTKGPEQSMNSIAPALDEASKELHDSKQTALVMIRAFADEIRNRPEEFWKFPYTECVYEFDEGPYMRFLFANAYSDLRDTANSLTDGAFDKYIEATCNIGNHYESALQAMRDGAISFKGNPWPLLEDGEPDLTPITNRLCQIPFCMFNDGPQAIYQCWEIPDYEDEWQPVKRVEQVTYSDPWEQYAALCALCLLIGKDALYSVTNKTRKSAEKHGEQQDTRKPHRHYDPINKLANNLTDKRLFGPNGLQLDVSGEKEKEVTTSVNFSIAGEQAIVTTKVLDPFDREVHAAVASWWKAGNRNFTPSQICQTLTGSQKPSKAMLDEVRESIEKQIQIRAEIDFTEEARGRNLEVDGEPIEECKIETYLLAAKKITVRAANGKTVEGYHLFEAPVLYWYAAATKQVVSYPQRYLKTASAGRSTVQNTLIKKYLLRRIGQIKGKSKVSNRIKFSTIYRNAGIDPDEKSRTELNRINNYITSLLDLWKEQGAITDYKEVLGPRKKRDAVDIFY